jgi:hypothetical protein
MLVLEVGGTNVANASIMNGGFETGDLSFWTASPSGLVSAAMSRDKELEVGTWLPTEGSFFGLLEGGAAGVYTLLSQIFAAASGAQLSFDVFFDSNEVAGDTLFSDDGYVKLVNTGTLVEFPLYSQSNLTVGSGSNGWTNVMFVIPTAGNYRIEAGVRNGGDSAFSSPLGLDNVQLVDGSGAVPEAASLAVWSIGSFVALIWLRLGIRQRETA